MPRSKVMKTLITILIALFVFLPFQVMAEGEDNGFKVQAWDFSDTGLDTTKGTPCADLLSYLMDPEAEKYKLLGTVGVAGPPGVVYTLKNNTGHIAILKCGTSGGHDDGGHESSI
jgi:hypothetical protein